MIVKQNYINGEWIDGVDLNLATSAVTIRRPLL